jgi:hypothetical protein
MAYFEVHEDRYVPYGEAEAKRQQAIERSHKRRLKRERRARRQELRMSLPAHHR